VYLTEQDFKTTCKFAEVQNAQIKLMLQS